MRAPRASKLTSGCSAHREPAGLSGCDVDAVCQGGDDQPGAVAKILIPTKQSTKALALVCRFTATCTQWVLFMLYAM